MDTDSPINKVIDDLADRITALENNLPVGIDEPTAEDDFLVAEGSTGTGSGSSTSSNLEWVRKSLSETQALILDIPNDQKILLGNDDAGEIYVDSNDDLYIKNVKEDKNIIFHVNDGGVDTEVMQILGATARLKLRNAKYISWDDSGGTARVVFGVDSADDLYVQNQHGGDLIIRNRVFDKDIIISINDNHVETEVVRIVGAESSVKITNMKSGATQAGAGAAANELWKTNSHATLPDNVVMTGV